jgi:hypothetical protein
MQARRHSLLEACVSTAIGFGIAYLTTLLVLPLFGFRVTVGQSLWITLIFTVISVIRGYWVRRLFNYLHQKGIL